MNKWSLRYLNLAKEVSTWSKDPSTKVGAISVGNKGQIISQGFNGFPRGVNDSDQRLNNKEQKYKYVVHGEMNCIYNACHNGSSLKDSTLYVYGLPICSECAKGVIQVGVAKVIMQHPKSITSKWSESFNLTSEMFNEANVQYLRYDEDYKLIV